MAIDRLKILSGDPICITDGVTLYQPTAADILDFGEIGFYIHFQIIQGGGSKDNEENIYTNGLRGHHDSCVLLQQGNGRDFLRKGRRRESAGKPDPTPAYAQQAAGTIVLCSLLSLFILPLSVLSGSRR